MPSAVMLGNCHMITQCPETAANHQDDYYPMLVHDIQQAEACPCPSLPCAVHFGFFGLMLPVCMAFASNRIL